MARPARSVNAAVTDYRARAPGQSKYLFKKDIKRFSIRPRKGGAAQFFHVMPGFNPNDLDAQDNLKNPASWYPHILNAAEDLENPSTFVAIQVSKAGRCDFKDKVELLSPKTFDVDAFCPIQAIVDIAKNEAEWKYLVTKKDWAWGGKFGDTILPEPRNQVLCNVVVPQDQPGLPPELRLGILEASAITCMQDMMFDLNVGVSDDELTRSPMARYKMGDFTNPANNTLLQIHSDATGQSKGYILEAVLSERRVSRFNLMSYLPGRYNLLQLENLINIPSLQDLVDNLAKILNERNERGRHEYELLHQALGHLPDILLPAIPPAGSVTGFNHQQTPGGYAPAAAGGYAPATATGGYAPAAPTGGYAPAAAPGGYTQAAHGAQAPAQHQQHNEGYATPAPLAGGFTGTSKRPGMRPGGNQNPPEVSFDSGSAEDDIPFDHGTAASVPRAPSAHTAANAAPGHAITGAVAPIPGLGNAGNSAGKSNFLGRLNNPQH